MRRIASVVLVLLFAPAIWTSARGLFPYVRWALSVSGQTPEQRREQVLGDWVRELRAIPRGASVDLVMATPQSRDTAVFVAAALAPRTCFIFGSWEGWRRLAPGTLYLDLRAVNESVRPRKHGDVVLLVDGDHVSRVTP